MLSMLELEDRGARPAARAVVPPAAEWRPWGLTTDSALLCRRVRQLIARETVTTAIDVGCSIGLTTMWAAWRNPGTRVTGIDIHAGAIADASRLAARPRLDGSISFRRMDYGNLGNETHDLVFANPPYIPNVLGLPGMDPSAVGADLLLNMIKDPFRHVAPGGRMVLVLSTASFASEEVRTGLDALTAQLRARRISRTLVPFDVTCVLSSPAFVHELARSGAIIRAPGGFLHSVEVWEFSAR